MPLISQTLHCIRLTCFSAILVRPCPNVYILFCSMKPDFSPLDRRQPDDYRTKCLPNNATRSRINAVMPATPLLKTIAAANNTAATPIDPTTSHFPFVINFTTSSYADRNAHQFCRSTHELLISLYRCKQYMSTHIRMFVQW